MALDIEPLSPARRAVMLVAMLGLLGAALAFAQVLVSSKRVVAPAYQVTVKAFPGLMEPVPEWESIDGVVLTGSGLLEGTGGTGGVPRRFAVLSYDADVSTQEQLREAQNLLLRITGGLDEVSSSVGLLLGRFPAVQILANTGRGSEATFAVVRLAVLKGHVVAICYSGAGPFTDFQYFNDFCQAAVTIRRLTQENPERGGTHE